jgi:hypothetical protein
MGFKEICYCRLRFRIEQSTRFTHCAMLLQERVALGGKCGYLCAQAFYGFVWHKFGFNGGRDTRARIMAAMRDCTATSRLCGLRSGGMLTSAVSSLFLVSI